MSTSLNFDVAEGTMSPMSIHSSRMKSRQKNPKTAIIPIKGGLNAFQSIDAMRKLVEPRIKHLRQSNIFQQSNRNFFSLKNADGFGNTHGNRYYKYDVT